MKGSVKYLNILVPILILACVLLFYIDGIINEGLVTPCGPVLTPTEQTYSIYIFKQNTPSPKLILKKVTGPTNWGSTTNNFKSSGQTALTIQNIPSTKLIDYQVYGRSSTSWVGMGCSDFSIKNGMNIILKPSLKSTISGSGAIGLSPSTGGITLTGNTLVFSIMNSTSITGIDTANNGANIRIDLLFS